MSDDKPPPKGPERRRWIIRRLEEGVTQTELARQIGISRQAVSETWNRHQRQGEDFFRQKGRRPRESDTLGNAERKEFVEWLRANTPESAGLSDSYWSMYAVKRAIRKRLGKAVKLSIAVDILWKAFPDGPPGKPDPSENSDEEDDPAPEDGKPTAAEGPRPPDSAPELPSLEEMDRAVQEYRESLPADSLPPGGPAPGVRVGKHAKGRKTPGTKPKRRKKKK